MSSDIIVIEKELLRSKAFRSLNGAAKNVYFDFCMKCRVKGRKAKGGGRKTEREILNNGQIEYAYSEALKKGITRPRFKRALKELVEHGFIDIAHSGSGGIKGDVSKYGISERWRSWGTDTFKETTMTKDTRKGRGFSVYWQNIKNTNIGNDIVT